MPSIAVRCLVPGPYYSARPIRFGSHGPSEEVYPGYQRFFSRAAGIFGVGRRPKPRAGHYKDLTETGNRARKVSGTQGRRSEA